MKLLLFRTLFWYECVTVAHVHFCFSENNILSKFFRERIFTSSSWFYSSYLIIQENLLTLLLMATTIFLNFLDLNAVWNRGDHGQCTKMLFNLYFFSAMFPHLLNTINSLDLSFQVLLTLQFSVIQSLALLPFCPLTVLYFNVCLPYWTAVANLSTVCETKYFQTGLPMLIFWNHFCYIFFFYIQCKWLK